jgi:hypothetical protein
MTKDMDAMITSHAKQSAGTSLLLRHCLSLGTAEHRVPVRVRLDEAIGPELARRLVASLVAHSRR